MTGKRPASIASPMRAFNRFYTERIGALDDRHEGFDITIAESRTLYTIDRLGAVEVGGIAEALQLDLGYVSRLVTRLERKGLIIRSVDPADRRRRVVRLSAAGAGLLAQVAHGSDQRMDVLTHHLSAEERRALLQAMNTIRALLQAAAERTT